MLEMFLKRMRKSKNQKGFTLVELIVVIAILGILAAVAVGRFGSIRDTAKLNSDYATAATIASASYAYEADKGEVATLAKLSSEGYLDKAKYTSQYYTGDMILEGGDSADYTVKAGTKNLYPKPDTPDAK